MGWLLFLAALLGLVFPPVAIVLVAMIILGVFAKGMGGDADSQEEVASVRRKTRHRHGAQRPHDAVRPHVTQPQPGQVFDVRCYPIVPPARLPEPTPESSDGPP